LFYLSFGTREEYEFRLSLFNEKDAEYKIINADANNTFTVGHNQFSTWIASEHKRLLVFGGVGTGEWPNPIFSWDISAAADVVRPLGST
jgi:hypothetical protein